jgi:hypothetical protein
VIREELPKDFLSEEDLERYPLLGFEVVAPSGHPERKSNSGSAELILEGTRLVLVNKKNIYTVFLKNVKEVIFQEMLQAPVEI